MDEARVEDVVGEYVVLKKRGANLLGNCPFHNEKTPSFTVTPAKNFYKCFGCGKSGNSVTFLMEHAQMSYVEALKFLAKKYNVEIEETFEPVSHEEQEKQSHAESILIANAFAQKYYTEILHSDEGSVGLSYFKERGFDKHTIEKFQMGFSPDKGDAFTKHALANSFQLQILKDAGLTSPKEGSTYDFFRNRVMFPIHNLNGKVVGFGGRILKKDEKAPKYVNTPESDVYNKSKILYGAFQAKVAIRKMDECYLVEGYTDVVSLHQAGIENVVASSGTALTIEQIRIIKRMTANITMLYDGDAAGIKAALRGTDMILEEGMNVRIVIFPDGEDPDSYVRKTGSEAFTKYVRETRKDLILFKTALFAKEASSDPIKKSELIRDIMGSIAKIPDAIQRSVYIKECSGHFGMQEQMLLIEVNKIRHKSNKGAAEISTPDTRRDEEVQQALHKEQLVETSPTLRVLESDIVRVMIAYGPFPIHLSDTETITVTQHILDELEGVEIEWPLYKKLYDDLKDKAEEGIYPSADSFLQNEDVETRTAAIDLLSEKYQVSENWWTRFKIAIVEKDAIYVRDVESALIRFKQFKNMHMLKSVEEQILQETQKPEEEQNPDHLNRLLRMHNMLTKQKRDFAKITETTVYRPNM